jgi:hypothetical protein
MIIKRCIVDARDGACLFTLASVHIKDRRLHYAVCCIMSDWLSRELIDLTSYLASLASGTSCGTGTSVRWPSPSPVVSEVIRVHR